MRRQRKMISSSVFDAAQSRKRFRVKRIWQKTAYHVIVSLLGIVMIYPLLWMIFSSFKPTNTIFTTAGQ